MLLHAVHDFHSYEYTSAKQTIKSLGLTLSVMQVLLMDVHACMCNQVVEDPQYTIDSGEKRVVHVL